MGSSFLADWPPTIPDTTESAGPPPPESTAVMATVAEPAVEVIDGEMAKLEGKVTRRPVAEVMDELEAAEEAAEGEARRTLRESERPS